MREEIERAFRPFFARKRVQTDAGVFDFNALDFDALAESAIVIEAEVEHVSDGEIPPNKYTVIYLRGMFTRPVTLSLRGHHGTPGPYLFIGFHKPEGKEKENEISDSG